MKLFYRVVSTRDMAVAREDRESVRGSASAPISHWSRLLRRTLGVALLMVGANAAHATCTPDTSTGPWNRPTNAALSGTYNVSPNLPNGTVIASFTAASIPGNIITFTCIYSSDATERDLISTPLPLSSYGSNIYQSGVPGIGVEITTASGSVIPSPSTSVGGFAGQQNFLTAPSQYLVNFIKIGPVGSGTVNAASVPTAGYRLTSQPAGSFFYYLTVSGSVQFTVPGCTVTAPTVQLGTHSVAEFTGSGYTTAPIDFNVTLSNCPTAGFIFYQFDDVNGYESMAQSIVKLQGGTGAATGIGVQLLNATTLSPFPMGAPQALTTGPSNFSLPFKARYSQMAGAVTTGLAKAAIGITLTYN